MSFFKGKRMAVFLSAVLMLAACGKSVQRHGTETQQRIFADLRKAGMETQEDGNVEPYIEELGSGNPIPYGVPLEEIAEKIEYLYTYGNMLYGQFYDYGELGALPSGENICLHIYLAEGNKLLFLPDGKGNREVLVNGESCSLYYSEKRAGYLFYYIGDFGTEEGGIPVNFIGGDFDGWWLGSCIMEGENLPAGDGRYYYRVESRDLTSLGEVEVEFDPLKKLDLPAVPVEGNEYMEAIVRGAKSALAKRGKFGDYEMYLGTYGRALDEANQYYEIYSSVFTAGGCIVGEGLEQYFFFNIWDIWDGQEIWCGFATYAPMDPESEELFVGTDLPAVNREESIRRVKDLEWIKIPFTVEDGVEYDADIYRAQWVRKNPNGPDGKKGMDFGTMSAGDAADLISYACSYSEWFGMNELGYCQGEIRGFMGKEMVMYTVPPRGDALLFIPMEMVNRVYEGEDGKEYPLYINRDGYAEFYCMRPNPYAQEQGDLKTTLCTIEEYCENCDLTLLGKARLERKDLPLFGLPEVEAHDEYVEALEEYVGGQLEQNGSRGRYKIYIGEYERISPSCTCISAAVSGEKEYYVRYLVIKSQNEKYYFWPAGFGLDRSLGECEAERHYMNGVCIERTKKLERYVSEIEIF